MLENSMQESAALALDQPKFEPDFAALGRLIAEVAHEARNPLASILAGLEAWEQEPEVDFEVFGPRIRREAGRLAQLMDGLLELTQPRRRSTRAVSIRLLVEDALASAVLGRDGDGTTLEATGLDEDLVVEGDPLALGRVLRNLIDNALQHAGADGVVRVTAERGPSVVRLRVEDGGPGFPAVALDRAFEPFFSLRRGGSGLGLAIVHKIVSEHDGSIELGNRPEGGAVAVVELPAREVAE